MNNYSETVITMTSHRADNMLISLWDASYQKMTPAINEVIKATGMPPESIRGLVAGALNAFEDLLREEWGVVNQAPEEE